MLADLLKKLLDLAHPPVLPVPQHGPRAMAVRNGDEWDIQQPDRSGLRVIPAHSEVAMLADLDSFVRHIPAAEAVYMERADRAQWRLKSTSISRKPDEFRITKAMDILPSPELDAWLNATQVEGLRGNPGPKTMTHAQLADFCLDNQESFADPLAARAMAVFRTVRKVTVDADHDTGATQGVRVDFGASAGAPGGAPVALPRVIEVRLQPFASMETPPLSFKVALRMIPPPANAPGDAQPVFSMKMMDLPAVVRNLQQLAERTVRDKLPKEVPLFMGASEIEKFYPLP